MKLITVNPAFKQMIGRMFFRISSAFGYRDDPAGFTRVGFARPGQPVAKKDDINAYWKTFSKEPWLRACQDVVAKQLSAAPLLLEFRKTVKGELEWIALDSGELYDILQFPNPSQSMFELLWQTVLGMSAGDAYWTIDPINDEIYYANPEYVEVVPREDGSVHRYNVERMGKKRILKPEHVINFKYPNPENDMYGLSTIRTLIDSLKLSQSHRDTVNEFFENGALFSGVMGTDRPMDANMANDWQKQIGRQLDVKHVGKGNAYKPLVVGSGLKFTQNSPPLEELIGESLREMTVEEICSVTGVPPMMVGFLRRATYSNYDIGQKVLWQLTILPIMRLLTSRINSHRGFWKFLGRPKDSDAGRYRVRFDISAIEALREDESQLVKNTTETFESGIISRDEARAKLGYETIGGELGEEFADVNLSRGRGGGSGFFGNQFTNKKSVYTDATVNDVLQARAAPTESSDQESHKSSLKRATNKFVPTLNEFNDDQFERVMANITDITFKGAYMSKLQRLMVIQMSKTRGDAEDKARLLFDIEEENRLLREAIDSDLNAAAQASGDQSIIRYSLDGAFDVKNPLVQVAISQSKNRITDINETTWGMIRDLITDTTEQGDSLPVFEKGLRKIYSDFPKSRVRTIARTEMSAVLNMGAHESYRQSGILQEQWLTASANVRPSHALANGQITPLDEPFLVGGDRLRFPGDPTGSAREVINCQCVLIPVLEKLN